MYLLALLSLVGSAYACSDFYMNFTDHKLSGRTMDLGLMSNWTLTSWPTAAEDTAGHPPLAFWTPKIGVVGVTANWFGDEQYGFPSLFADSLNEQGLSCSLLALNVAQYEDRSDAKTNVFAGLFCFYVAQNFGNVYDLQAALLGVAIWGPDALAQHFIVHDASGASLIVEVVGGKQHVYLDTNSGQNGT
jgi:choloylglycine hydrolase